MRGLLVAAAFAAGLALGFAIWNEGGAGGRASRVVTQEAAAGRAPEAAAHSSAPEGAGRITGFVRAEDGSPIEGAVVVATPVAPAPKRSLSAPPAKPPQLPRSEAISRENGSYAIERLTDTEYTITAFAAGYLLSPRPDARVHPDAAVDFEGRRLVRVPVTIEVEGAPPPARARIRVLRPAFPRDAQSWTADEPWFELTPGLWEVRAELEDETRSRSKPQTISIRAGEEAGPVRFIVRVRPALVVEVKTASQYLHAPLVCWLRPCSGDRPPSPRELASSGVTAYRLGTTEFEFRDLEPGRYAIGAGYGELQFEPQVVELVDVPQGLVRAEIDLPDPPAGGGIRIRLLDPHGAPVTRAVWAVQSGGASATGVESVVRADGVHFLRAPDAAGTVIRLEARSREWGVTAREFSWDPAREEEMRYAGVARVTGTIRGYAGSGYEGRIRFRWEDPAARPSTSSVDFGPRSGIADDGTIAEHAEQTGYRVLALYVNTGSFMWTRVAETRVELRPGTQAVTIAMPALHALRVRWQGEGRPELVLLGERKGVEPDELMWTAEVDENGIAAFDGLLPGRYQLGSPSENAQEPLRIDIPAQAEVDLK